MSERVVVLTYTVLRPDGSQQRYTLLSVGPLARLMDADARSAHRYLTTLTTPAIRIQARACVTHARLRHEADPAWATRILGLKPPSSDQPP